MERDVVLPVERVTGLRPLDQGGGSTVYDTGLTLRDVDGPLVYKQYRNPVHDERSLRVLVEHRRSLSPRLRDELDRLAAWPVRVVVNGGVIVGVVMPRVPERFFADQGGQRRPMQFASLARSQEECERCEIAWADTAQRLTLLRAGAEALALLHRLGVVAGDLSLRNLLYCLHPAPAVMLVDCDGFRVTALGTDVAQAHSPGFEPPEAASARLLATHLRSTRQAPLDAERLEARANVQSTSSDVYKFALLAIRSLRPGPGATLAADPLRVVDLLPPAAAVLLFASMAADANVRPTAEQWCDALKTDVDVPPPKISAWTRSEDGGWYR